MVLFSLNMFNDFVNVRMMARNWWLERMMPTFHRIIGSRQSRFAPTFSIDLWNMQSRVADGLPRTNNLVEGCWRCVRRNCVGRRKQFTDALSVEITSHIHAPDNAKNYWFVAVNPSVNCFLLPTQLQRTHLQDVEPFALHLSQCYRYPS